MKKIIFTILLCGVMVLNLTGCNNKKRDTDIKKDIYSFKATITECEEKSMIVKPNENETINKSADAIRIKYVDGYNSCNVNDRVKVTYEGYLNDSYPAQIGAIKIESIE